jgi:Fe-Mn family superoxide dismutase
MAISLPELPYGKDALAPVISANTLDFHHDKHHKAYVDNLNKLITGTDLEGKPLEEIIKITAKDSAKAGIFNNAAQVWNHSFYWQCLKKSGGGAPTGAIAAKINAA